MELELKHIAPYLPYGLEWFCLDRDSREYEILATAMIDFEKETIEIGGMDFDWSELPYPNGLEIKPILRPLLEIDLSKTTETVLGGSNYENGKLLTEYKVHFVSCIGTLEDCEYLFSNHFDVFGLIEKGLAIDINTLKS